MVNDPSMAAGGLNTKTIISLTAALATSSSFMSFLGLLMESGHTWNMQRPHTAVLRSVSIWGVKVPCRGDLSRTFSLILPHEHFQEQFCFTRKSSEYSY